MRKLLLLTLPLFLLLVSYQKPVPVTITGTVKDNTGAPVIAAKVSIKGTTASTVTKSDGTYSIMAPDEKSRLVFSSVGFITQEVAIKGRQVIDVILMQTSHSLQEVLVTGYGNAPVTASTPGFNGYVQGRVAGISIGNNGYNKRNQKRGAIADTAFNTEEYDGIVENPFKAPAANPLSTFSIDVDAAAYSNVRRYLNEGKLPPNDAVRIEEMINYFSYSYTAPVTDHPFAVHTELAACPWNTKHQLLSIGLQGVRIPTENLPPSNLVFLIDVSGSMMAPNRLPLVKTSLKLLVDQLREKDNVAIVVYAGAAGLVLPSTSGASKIKIKEAIDGLEAGGSTAGGAGIKLAYKIAREAFMEEGNNRVILCTDGDFNVGISSNGALEDLIEAERKSNVFLTVLGYGMGNYKDSKLQRLANKGNGNHAYIDGLSEAKKVLVNEFGGTLFTIAKDVKLQLEFNPANVAGYRLIGYENRLLAAEDFNDDEKDAGELGSGHTVTALYEIIPAGVKSSFLKEVDALKYQGAAKNTKASITDELVTIKLRYKKPDGLQSRLLQTTVADKPTMVEATSENFRFAAAVAQFGLLLRGSQFKQEANFDNVLKLAIAAKGTDVEGYREEFVKLVRKAAFLQSENDEARAKN